MTARRVAFYAPMKAPDHPVPSGDRQIARLTLAALDQAGFDARVVSDLRIFDRDGDPDLQRRLAAEAAAEVARLEAEMAAAPPALWFTYHCHYKAPDLIGPEVARALGIPYVLSEPSISPRRREGPWSRFALAAEAAIGAADRLFWTTARDRPALEAAGLDSRMVHLPAFLDPGGEVAPRDAGLPLRLLTVAMMRSGDKLESYRRLAQGLQALPDTADWQLEICGDGPVRAEVEALFAGWPARVRFRGAIEGAELRAAYEAADLFVWPGVGEGVGMVYLEAQAAGLPVVAEDHAAQRELVAAPLAAPGEGHALAAAIEAARDARRGLAVQARAHVLAHHSIAAAAELLRRELSGLLR